MGLGFGNMSIQGSETMGAGLPLPLALKLRVRVLGMSAVGVRVLAAR